MFLCCDTIFPGAESSLKKIAPVCGNAVEFSREYGAFGKSFHGCAMTSAVRTFCETFNSLIEDLASDDVHARRAFDTLEQTLGSEAILNVLLSSNIDQEIRLHALYSFARFSQPSSFSLRGVWEICRAEKGNEWRSQILSKIGMMGFKPLETLPLWLFALTDEDEVVSTSAIHAILQTLPRLTTQDLHRLRSRAV
jgi:hypothetical protein